MFQESLLKKALQIYAGEHILEHVLEHGERAFTLAPVMKNVTVAIANFVALPPNPNVPTPVPPSPEGIVSWMNEYYSAVTRCIHQRGGIIEGFAGDATVACWGLKENSPHAVDACLCALDCLSAIDKLMTNHEAVGKSAMRLSIGICTGNALVGNMGSPERLKFTLFGPAINMASRLTAMCNATAPVILTKSTQQQLDGKIKTRSLPSVMVKGMPEPLELFALTGW